MILFYWFAIVKALDSSISGKTGTMGGSSVTIGNDTGFTYKVTLTRKSGSTLYLNDYLSWSALTALNAGSVKINGSTDITNDNQSTDYTGVTSVEFTVPVSVNVPKVINGLPYGTTYSVEEINLPEFTDGSCAVDNVPSGTIGTIVSATGKYYTESGTDYNQATITNSFVQKGSLTVRKENATAPGSTQPTYKSTVTLRITLQKIDGSGNPVTWTDPTDMTMPHGGTLTSVSGDSTNSLRYFDVSIAPNTDVKVLDFIPLGEVKYKVEEVTSSAEITDYDCTTTYSPNTANTGFTTINASASTPKVTVKNTYTQHGKITLKKELSGTDAAKAAAGVNGNTQFTYVVTLTAPNNKTWAEMRALGIAIPSGSVDETDGTKMTITFTSGTDGVSVSNSREITNIPYGTTYEVEETYTYTGGNGITWTKTVNPSTAQQIGSSNASVTIDNAYVEGAKGTITIKKELTTIKGGSNVNQGEGKSFTYNVMLSNAGINWSTYGDQLTIGGLTGSKSYSSTTDHTNDICTFQVIVPAHGEISISGIPDGTTYSISEVADNDYTLISLDGGTTTLSVTNAAINVSTATEYTHTFVNERKTGKLDLSKTVSGSAAALTATGISTDASGTPTEFTYQVTLEAPTADVDLADYLSVAELNSDTVPHVSSAVYHAKDTEANPAVPKSYITFDVTLTGVENVVKEITNIPYGTTYTVVEADVSRAKTSSVVYTVNNVAASDNQETTDVDESTYGTGTIGASNTVNVTNTYPDVRSLTLKKTVIGTDAALVLAQVSRGSDGTPFTFTVDLKVPDGLSINLHDFITSPISGAVTTEGTYTYDNDHYHFKVQVKDDGGNGFVINNIPDAVQFKVVEDDLSYTFVNHVKANEVDSYTTLDNSNNEVTITNTYTSILGSLSLNKERAAAANTTTVLPTDAGSKTFKFNVTLKALGIATWYRTSTLEGLPANVTAAPLTKPNEISFQIDVTEGTSKNITGIPLGTEYTVTEDFTDGYYTEPVTGNRYYVTKSDEVTNYVKINSTNQTPSVTIKNTYLQVGKLTLDKQLADRTTDSEPPTDFIYQVVLTAQSGMNLQTYNTGNGVITLNEGKQFVNGTTGEPISTSAQYGTYGTNGSTYTFFVKVNANETNGYVEINNIPYGTAYEVTEILTTAQTNAGWMKGVGTYGTTTTETQGETPDTVTVTKHYIGAEDNTHHNTFTSVNAKTAELVLHEVLLNGITNHSDDKFTFTADLVAPDGIRFTSSDFTVTYVDGENVTHTISPASDDLTVTVFTVVEGTEVTGDTHARIVVKISNTLSAVTISGIPYGTEYTVGQTAMPDNTAYSKWVKVDDYYHAPPANDTPDADKHFITEPTQHFTAENAITGAVKISKTVEATEGSTLPANATFDFTAGISNVPSGLDLSNFPISTDFDGTNKLTVTNGSFTVPVDVTSGNTSEHPAEVIIYGIPQGAEVSISEDAVPSASWENTSDNTSYTITIGDNFASTTAAFKNTFTSQSITLFKQDAANSAGIKDAHFYLLKLKADTDITSDTVKAAFASNNIDNVVPAYADKVTTVGSDVVIHVGQPNQTTLYNVLTTSSEGLITVSEPSVDFTTGNRYFFYEADLTTASVGGVITTYYMDHTLSPSKIVTIDGTKTTYPVTYTNYRKGSSTGVELFKTNDSNDPLPAAEFDLYYKVNTTPPTYSVNDPYYTPLPTSTNLVSGNKTIPGEPDPISYDTYDYEYQYKDTPVPSASDTEWIQPRTDNDYIYFRDYNDATTGYIGSQDQQSFTVDNSGVNNTNSGAQNDKRSWIFTNFKDNEFGQDQEIDYDHSYWIMAVFSGHPTKNDKPEYGVWERFVDRVNLNGKAQDTVVWKIQPPDGYTKVRFLLYHDYWVDGQEYKTCIRSTKEITFKLGEIYHKTSYGEWKLKNHHECYFNAPCTSEGTWSTYKTAANSQTQVEDKRQTGANTNNLYQADRYTPTQQKIIFHCNSKTVWHNIHIEFFTKTSNGRAAVNIDGTNYYPLGQSAPGYLMEPYAYAGNDYRINGSLTYELTIPAEAEYFRVNNGVASGNTYYYCSKIKKLKHDTDRNNYGNYFSINGSSSKQEVIGRVPVTLGSWNDYTNYGDKWYESYTENDVDSDYDYIYFEKPSDWGNHVYAYFYAGNDLRDDNWQRATYTAWPGVAPVGTEYVEHNKTVTIDADGQGTETAHDDVTYHSDVYNYSYTGNLYAASGSGSLAQVSPETTINNGSKVIYKFRIPKSEQKSYTNGEKRNYFNVIFNDGLYSQGGRNETRAMKDFKAGYLYYSNGSSKKHYDNKPTATYNKRGTGDDYIYIKTTDTTNWDDIHITFYKSGTQILQGGKGYVMDYAGKQKENDTEYSYFRAAIPTNATQFSINNGKDDSSRVTPKYDILRLSTTTEGTDKADYTKDHLVYELNSSAKTLTMTAPHFKKTENVTHHSSGAQSSGKDYAARQTVSGTDDMLYIRNTAGWTMGIGGAQVKFYDENGAQLGITGTYTLIMSKTETDAQAEANGYTAAKEWYSIPIPENAVSFTVTYDNGTKTTGRTAIYPSGDTNSRNGNYTTGNMYYETESGGTLSVISSTVTHPGQYIDPIYVPNHTRNGDGTDYLYLVCANKNDWQDMTVTFKDGTGTTIKFTDTDDNEYSLFPVQYLNEIKAAPAGETPISGETSDDPKAVGHWYKVAIPDGAKSFTVSRTNGADTSSAVIYDLAAKTSVYKKDYTLGDMQYRLPDSGTSPTLLYPVFTEIEGISMEVGDDAVSGTGAIQADATAVAAYESAAPATAPSYTANEPNNPYPVLYNTHTNVTGTYSTGNTSSNNVTKTWTQHVNGDGKLRFDNTTLKWGTVTAKFYNSSDTLLDTVNVTDSTGSVVAFTVPDGATKVDFSKNGSTTSGEHTGILDMSSQNNGRNRKYIPATTSTQTPNSTVYAYWSSKGAGSNTDNDKTAIFYASNKSTVVYTYNAGSTSCHYGDPAYNNNNYWGYEIGTNWSQTPYYVKFGCKDNGDVWYYTPILKFRKIDPDSTTETVDFDYLTQYVRATGHNSSNVVQYTPTAIPSSNSQTTTVYSVSTTPGTWATTNEGSSDATYTANYQIEDRYGYVSDLNGTYGNDGDDKDNYIYLNTTMSNPYVMFYTGTGGSGDKIGGVNGTTTVGGIKADSVGTNLYRVRLPRAAQSFVVTSGAVANPTTDNAYNLYQTGVQYTVGTGGNAQTYTLNGTYHHAGTTFDVTPTGLVTINKLRTGFTPNRETTLTDPLNPRSDADYVFFTDTNGNFANSNTVHAYFYGGADGEFTKWPGTKASTPTGTDAATTYTDNYGRTVYMFRIPQDDEGTYPYVIFNNGSNNITQAQQVVGGKNYVLDTNTDNDKTYGTFDASAQAATPKDRTTETSGTLYSTSGTNRYIYIVNNGTQNLQVTGDTPALDTGRFTLDDMHVVFYDENKRPIGVGGGTGYAGYKPDRLLSVNYTEKNAENVTISGPHDVYRIQVPNGAKYFQINNGEREEEGLTATQFNERQSELKAIAANGLYKFVERENDPQKYIEATDTMPTGNDATRQAPHYLLTLVNEVKTDEYIPETDTYYVKLATVVTKDTRNGTESDPTGNIDYIKWLKLNDEGTQVDQNYLDHTLNDIYHPATDTTPESGTKQTAVKVVKKGTYYWIENVAPAGYELNEDRQDFVVKSDGEVTPTVKVFTYNDNNELVPANPENTVTVIDTPLSGEVVLTKVSKEKVGSADIGTLLSGAKFKLIKIKDDGTEDDTLRFSRNTSVTDTNEYSLSSTAAYNTTNSWLETGADGKLTIKGLLPGDYCLEEQEGAEGYSHLNHHTGEAQRVYFSTGSNTIKKEITLADEIAPAYIKLYEHINEKREEWGDPTFIFRIRQVQHYDWVDGENEGDPKVWQLTDSDTEKEILVALTVNDDGKYTAGLLSHDDPSYNYLEWFEESTGEPEYKGVFNILSDGRIRVEPGKYEITRVPVSRYEFVENTYTMDNVADEDKPQDYINHRTATEKLTVTIPAERTAIIHYYDKVGYYDKFTHIDEEINKFYKLGDGENGTTAGENLAVKGIRVDNYSVDTDEGTTYHDTLDTATDTLTVAVTQPTRFKAYWIMVDGSEKQITDPTELAKFEITYQYDEESGDDEHFGNQADESDNDFSYNTTSDVITVRNYTARYKNGVYTLKATYDGKFSANFDIVFEKS